MRKRASLVGIMLVLATAFCMNAYAADTESAWHGFWGSVGGFFHKVAPWNWGENN
jgi:hypothetical protein